MSFEDYYGYPDEGYNGDDDMSFLLGLFGSPQFGDPSMGMPGETFSQRRSNLAGIEGLLGIPLTQLMGGGSVSQETMAPMPTEGVSYTRQVYGKAPQFADAFAAIDQNVDPQSVYQELLNKAGEYGINFAPGTPEYQDWADRAFGVINDYAFESAKNGAEYDKAMAEWEASAQNAGNTFKIGTKTYQGQPDINGMASQHDLMGAPDLQTLMKTVAASRTKQPNVDYVPKQDGPIKPGTPEYQAIFSGAPYDSTPDPYADVQSPEWHADRNMAQTPKAEGLWAAKQEAERYQKEGGNIFQKQMDRGFLQPKLERSKNTMVRSDANAEAMRKVMALRALLGA